MDRVLPYRGTHEAIASNQLMDPGAVTFLRTDRAQPQSHVPLHFRDAPCAVRCQNLTQVHGISVRKVSNSPHHDESDSLEQRSHVENGPAYPAIIRSVGTSLPEEVWGSRLVKSHWRVRRVVVDAVSNFAANSAGKAAVCGQRS